MTRLFVEHNHTKVLRRNESELWGLSSKRADYGTHLAFPR